MGSWTDKITETEQWIQIFFKYRLTWIVFDVDGGLICKYIKLFSPQLSKEYKSGNYEHLDNEQINWVKHVIWLWQLKAIDTNVNIVYVTLKFILQVR